MTRRSDILVVTKAEEKAQDDFAKEIKQMVESRGFLDEEMNFLNYSRGMQKNPTRQKMMDGTS